jgi:hypothetical protein
MRVVVFEEDVACGEGSVQTRCRSGPAPGSGARGAWLLRKMTSRVTAMMSLPRWPVSCKRFLVMVVAGVATCCGGSGATGASTGITAPSTTAPTTTSVSVSGASPAIGATVQFVATAVLTTGATQTVTTQASWQSSNASAASVSATGVVTGVAAGEADITATYQAIAGKTHVVILKPGISVYVVSGTITDGTSGGILPNISVQIVDGANAGASTKTSGTGTYSLTGISAGTFAVSVSATSYVTTTKTVTVAADTRLDVVLPRTSATPAPSPTPSPGAATGQLAVSTTASQGWSSIEVTIGGQAAGTLTKFFEPSSSPSSCVAVAGGRVVATVPAGNVTYSARANNGETWTGTATVPANGCLEVILTCTNRDCAGAPAPTPTPTPTPTFNWVLGPGNLEFCSGSLCLDFRGSATNTGTGCATSVWFHVEFFTQEFGSFVPDPLVLPADSTPSNTLVRPGQSLAFTTGTVFNLSNRHITGDTATVHYTSVSCQ